MEEFNSASVNPTINLVKLENSNVGYVPFGSSLLPSRNYCFSELFKSRSFKVGWGRGFNFTQYFNANIINVLAIESTIPENDCDDSKLLHQLKTVLESTEFTFENGVPCCKVFSSKRMMKQLGETAEFDIQNDEEKYYSNIWKLLTVLFEKRDNNFEVKKKFSEWLENAIEDISPDVNLEIGLWNRERAVRNILNLLSGHKILEATQLALRIGMPQMSLLLSQINSTVKSRMLLQKQMKQWINMMANNLIKNEILKLYLMLAGLPTTMDINVCESLDWLRCLGMFLWYISPPADNINDSFNLYTEAFKTFAKAPFAPYSKDVCNYYDVMYLIIALYVDKKLPIEKIITPETYSNNILDHRLSWLLLQTFCSLDLGVKSENVYNQVCINFSTQLESMNHYSWGIYVLLFLNDNNVKEDLIMKILYRNMYSLNINYVLEQEKLLITKFKIPVTWIEKVKASRAMLLRKYWDSFSHLHYASNWKESHDLAIKELIPKLFINGKYSDIVNMFNPILPHFKDIENWSTAGGLILDFLKLRQTFLINEKQNLNLIRFDFADQLQDVVYRLGKFPISTAESALCVTKISKCCLIMFKKLKECDMKLTKVRFHYLEELIMPGDYKMNELLDCLNEFVKESI